MQIGRSGAGRVVFWGALLTAPGAWAAEESDWPRWRGPEGAGVTREGNWRSEALLPAPKVLWRANVGAGHSSVLVSRGRLYTLGNLGGRDLVWCLDAEKGRRIWVFSYVCPAGNFAGPRATPALDGGFLYTLSRQGHAFCLEADTGRVKWQRNLVEEFGARVPDYGITGTPLVVGDAVIYNAGAGGVALHKGTGEKLWAGPPGPCGYASPVYVHAGERDLVALFGAAELRLVDPAGGAVAASFGWRTPFDANAADPVAWEGKIFITSGWETGGALLEVSGGGLRPLWQSKNFRGQFASPVLWEGHFYGVDNNTPNGELRCLEAAAGRLIWAQKGGFENLIVAGGRIVAIDRRGALVVAEASPAGYRELARATVFSPQSKNWTAPVLARGRIYARNGDGDLVCMDVR